MRGQGGGRRPKPRALRVLEGNPGKRPLPQHEPAPKVEAPACPDHLDADAREEWARLAPRLLDLRVLSALDRAALAAYCASWSRWVWAESAIRKLRSRTVTSRSGSTKLHPYFGLAAQAKRELREWAVELGITPTSRARIRPAAVTEPEPDPSERFFRGPPDRRP